MNAVHGRSFISHLTLRTYFQALQEHDLLRDSYGVLRGDISVTASMRRRWRVPQWHKGKRASTRVSPNAVIE